MDDRQTQIREGAGLEESRLNVEFIEFLRKYSTPILVIIALIAGGYAGFNYLEKQRLVARDSAFVQLESALASRSVKSLASVAEENSGIAAVPILARLNEADLHLEAYRDGLHPGIQLTHDPATDQYNLPADEKYLTEEERAAELAQAAALYKTVADETISDKSRALLAIGALSGLASVAECQGKIDEARAEYQKVIDTAKGAGYDALEAAAKKRLDGINDVATPQKLFALADLPKAARAGGKSPGLIQAKTPDGEITSFKPDPEHPQILQPVQTDPSAPPPPGGTPLPPVDPGQPKPAAEPVSPPTPH